MKKILILWTFLAILLVLALTLVGINIKKQNAPYQELEETIKFKAESLIGANPSLIKELNYKITIEELNKNGYEVTNVVNNDSCSGYVSIIQQGNVLKYEPFIKCQNYETKGYSK